MRINKNYDIAKLAEELRAEISDAKKPPYNGTVKLDIVIANNILDVLEETQRREQKHQTLESALTFIEKEDGTHTNLMEETSKAKGFKCFGKYDTSDIECFTCNNEKQCREMTNRLKLETGCFGEYEEKEINCKNCEYNKECRMDSLEKTKTKLLEENKQTCEFSCFGNYGEEDEWEDDCEECMYAIECKKLYEQKRRKKR